MKKLAVLFIFATFSFAVFAAETQANAQSNPKSEVETLRLKIAELEKLLGDSEKAMFDAISKDMQIISKLRAENRELKAKLENTASPVVSVDTAAAIARTRPNAPALPRPTPNAGFTEQEVAAITAQRKQAENAKIAGGAASQYKTPGEQYDALRAEAAKVKKLSDEFNADFEKVKKQNEEAVKKAEQEKQQAEKKGDCFWDNAFPF